MEVEYLTERLIAHADQNTKAGRLYASTYRNLLARIGEQPTPEQLSHIDIICRLRVEISELRRDNNPQYRRELSSLNRDLGAATHFLFGANHHRRPRRVKPMSELVDEVA
jgi:hypothetical protein